MNGRRVQGGFFRAVLPALAGTVKHGTTGGTEETNHTGDTNSGGGGGFDPCIIGGICVTLP